MDAKAQPSSPSKPQRVAPPARLQGLRWFAVRYDRDRAVYQLVVPDTRETFVLGPAHEALAYFERMGLAYLGGRSLDAARAFGASQALPAENRAWGMDLTDPRVDPTVGAIQAREDYDRLLGGITDDDEDEDL